MLCFPVACQISRVRCVDDTCLPYKGQDWNPADVARHVQAAAEEWRPTVVGLAPVEWKTSVTEEVQCIRGRRTRVGFGS